MTLFAPSIERAQDLRRAMDRALWDSARSLLSERGELADAGQEDAGQLPDLTNMLDYAAYYDLALCDRVPEEISDEQQQASIDHLNARLANLPPIEAPRATPRISNLDEQHYWPHQITQIRRWIDLEPQNRMAMVAVDEADVAHGKAVVEEALDYLNLAVPEMRGEIETILRDIVFSRPDGTSNTIAYTGASGFAVWGCQTLNASTERHWTQAYRQVVHEAAHSVLFAIAREEPLIASDPGARHESPIRADLRPIDGIFHAAFVSTREAMAIDALLVRHQSEPCLSDSDDERLETQLENSVFAFWDCVEQLRGDAVQLSPLGETLLGECEAFMQANFAIEPV